MHRSSSPSTRIPVYDDEWGEYFTRKLNDYMDGIYHDLDVDGDPETLSGEPFDGCETCDFRERHRRRFWRGVRSRGYE